MCILYQFMFLLVFVYSIQLICLGFPLTISLIGAQLEMHQEDTLSNADRWMFYLDALSDKTNEPFK